MLYLLSGNVSPGNVVVSATDDPSNVYTIRAANSSKRYNPREFHAFKKFWIMLLYTGLCIGVQINFSINGNLLVVLSQQWDVSLTAAVLTMSIFMIAMGISVIFCGPLSELHGRKNVLCYTVFLSGIITIFSSLTDEFKQYLVCRFFSGLLGAPAMLIGGSVVNDLFNEKSRSFVLCVISVFIGIMPAVGAVLGSLSAPGFQKLGHINLIPGSIIIFFGALAIVFIPETYQPVINKRMERKINRSNSTKKSIINHYNLDVLSENMQNYKRDRPTISIKDDQNYKGNDIVFQSEMLNQQNQANGYFKYLMKKLITPYKFLMDPILLIISICASYYAGSMYFHVTNFPSLIKKFHEENNIINEGSIKPELIGLASSLGILVVGNSLLVASSFLFSYLITTYKKILPELRLIPFLIGSIMITIGDFLIYGSGINFENMIMIFIGQLLHGAGFFLSQQSILLYIMEVYGINSASACSLFSVFRNIIGGLVPLSGSGVLMRYGSEAFLIMGVVNSVTSISISVVVALGHRVRPFLKLSEVKQRYKYFD